MGRRWKVEKCTLDGAEAILNTLELDGWTVKLVQVVESKVMGPVEGTSAEGGGKVLGEFRMRSVVIFAQRREEQKDGGS